MSRLETVFSQLRAEGRSALIPFFTAGDPTPEVTVPMLHALAGAGADVIEVGVPFSDPMADGPVIQKSNERALATGTPILRETVHHRVPVWLLDPEDPAEELNRRLAACLAFQALAPDDLGGRLFLHSGRDRGCAWRAWATTRRWPSPTAMRWRRWRWRQPRPRPDRCRPAAGATLHRPSPRRRQRGTLGRAGAGAVLADRGRGAVCG